ncbi:hypothetical protein JW890_08500 [candidate division WOR-3 bacterium]|nr:hypothetical protein [candidate division WOR-3 bacterium]
MKSIIFVLALNVIGNSGPSPARAVLSSVLIPGGGQFYTGRTARGIVIGTVQGFLLSSTLYNHYKYKHYLSEFEKTGDIQDSLRYRGFYDMRNNLLWWDALVISISAIDAYVGAKMYAYYEHIENGSERINIGVVLNW